MYMAFTFLRICQLTLQWCHNAFETETDEEEQDVRLQVVAIDRRGSKDECVDEMFGPCEVGGNVNTEVRGTIPPRGTRSRTQAPERTSCHGNRSRDLPRDVSYVEVHSPDPRNESDKWTKRYMQEIQSRDSTGGSAPEKSKGTAGEKLLVYYGSAHSLHGKEFPHQVSELRIPRTDEAVTSSVADEELFPAENDNNEVAEGLLRPLDLAVRVASSSEDIGLCECPSMRLQQRCGSQFTGLDLSSEKLDDTLLKDDPRRADTIAQMPFHAPSTDLTELEHSLGYWHQQHSQQNYDRMTHGNNELQSKVRYNDTGSLEEVNHEHQVDYVVQGGEELKYVLCGQSAQYQYRQLWSLRATLAKNEYLLNQRVMNKERVTSAVRSVASFKCNQSSIEIYPGSAVEISAGSRVSDGAVSYSSEEISHKTRRQMYISAANSRKKRTEVQNVYQYDTLSFSDSHESFDTIDNEYYSTDTSITDEPENYGIYGSGNDRQAYRLQQLHADSGYRSLENPPAPNLATHQQSFDMAARLPPIIPIPDTGCQIEMPVCYNTSHDSQGRDFSTKHRDSTEGMTQAMTRGYSTSLSLYCHEPDEGVAGLNSPPPTNSDFGAWEKCQRQKYRSASRRRREFGVGGGCHALAHVMTDTEHLRPHFFQNFSATYPRDYSVDEKSDALFREFSRCDPVKVRPTNSHRQQLIHSVPYPFQDQKNTLSEPQGSNEEWLPQDSVVLDVTREKSGVYDSHDHCRVNCDNYGEDYETEEEEEDND